MKFSTDDGRLEPDNGSTVRPAQRIFDAIGAQLILHHSFADEAPRVGDEYEIIEILGAGGFGLICRATQLALRRPVALKLFPLGEGGGDDHGVREALREARSLARLEHPGIVTVYAAGESVVVAGERLPCAYVEMQLIDGVDLRAWLTDKVRAGEQVLGVLLEAGRALAHAHAAGIVHRDFKPENVMVDRHGRARVIDFGLALVAEANDFGLALDEWSSDADAVGTRATGTGLVRGTPGYMAPEVSQGRPRAASDQFALAVVIREALTGRHPFASHDNADARIPTGGPELFEQIRPLIDRSMAPTPADRFADVNELCDAIARATDLDGQPPARRRWPRLALALGSVSLLAFGAWFLGDNLTRVDPQAPPVTSRPPDTAAPPRAMEPAKTPTPSPEQDPQPPPEPGPEPTSASCADLDSWMGTWQATTKVTWTEYAYQHDWRVDYELELTLAERCVVSVTARKFPPMVEGQPPGAALEVETSAVALREAGGVWRLPLRLAFPNDGRTYTADEYYETVLLLDRQGDAEPRLRGAYRKLAEDGYWVRLGLLEGARGVAPDPRAITTAGLACAARCRIDCAGSQAESDCYARQCAPLDDSGDSCGPPSHDFRTPMRALATRQALRDGKDPFAQSLERGSKKLLLAQCADNARQLAGRWGLWLGDELTTLELQDDGCELSGTLRAQAGDVEVAGYVTFSGTWVVHPRTEPAPSWLEHPLVLVGVGREGPAFGTDIGDPARQLRAFRARDATQ